MKGIQYSWAVAQSMLNTAKEREERLETRILALENDCEGLNRMLREHEYAQGEIDSYVAQCERIDALGTALRELMRLVMEAGAPIYGSREGSARFLACIAAADTAYALLHDSTEHEESGG